MVNEELENEVHRILKKYSLSTINLNYVVRVAYENNNPNPIVFLGLPPDSFLHLIYYNKKYYYRVLKQIPKVGDTIKDILYKTENKKYYIESIEYDGMHFDVPFLQINVTDMLLLRNQKNQLKMIR